MWADWWDAFGVFERCRIDLRSAGMGAFYDGINPAEIHAVAQLMGVAQNQWPQLLDDVLFMGRAVSNELNAREAQRQKPERRK